MKDLLDQYGAEMTLDEETYEIIRDKVGKLGIVSSYDFREEHDFSRKESFVYDAMTGQYR